MKILPWRRAPGSAAARALAEEIKRIAVAGTNANRASDAIAKLISESTETDVRGALQILLTEPEVLFPDNYWFRPRSGLIRLASIRRAAQDPTTARLAAEALIRIHQKRPAWAFAQAGDFLGALILQAIANVADADLPATCDGLLALIAYINTVRARPLGQFVMPPEPPPRFILEAVGVLQSRDEALAWRIIDELAQGPSSLAKVLRRVTSLRGGALAVHGLADSVLKLIELASDMKATPTKAWLLRWEQVRAKASPGMREALMALTLDGEVSPDLTYGGSGTDIPRAAVIALASWNDPETRAFLRKAVLNWSRSGVGAPAIGTAAVWSLASYGDHDAIATMLDIRRRIHHKNLLKRLNQEIDRLSKKLGVDPDDIADESVDDCGLDAAGGRSWTLGDYTITLKLGAHGGITRTVFRHGKEVKDLPAPVRKEHAATWSEVTAASKLLKETVSAQRQRLEQAMVDGRQWDLEQWDRVFRAHPILWNLAWRLVWEAEAGEAKGLARPAADGWTGEDVEWLPDIARLRIAHAVTMSPAEQSYWQHRIVSEEIVQPFKQVFRETYFVTPAEVQEGDRSHRFSGHVIPNQMMYALAKGRGWAGTMGLSGFDGSGVGAREFPTWGVRATIEEAPGQNDFSTIAEVAFVRRDEKGLWWRARVDQIPPIPFSEAMRDIDLVVAVASIGTDEQWLDWEARREAGTADWTEQQRAYARMASAASAVRGQLLNEMIPRLGLSGRVTVEGHFAHVRGRRANYRIHLGSANIHMEPSGRYLCIVPAPGKERPIYLPFEDSDLKSAEVLSKILFLVRDDKITDPVITAQLPYADR